MTNQRIYIAYAVTSNRAAGQIPLCWHTSKQRAGEVGEALAKQDGLTFDGVLSCDEADYQAKACLPDNHHLNIKK